MQGSDENLETFLTDHLVIDRRLSFGYTHISAQYAVQLKSPVHDP
jgi:hypothetical protein